MPAFVCAHAKNNLATIKALISVSRNTTRIPSFLTVLCHCCCSTLSDKAEKNMKTCYGRLYIDYNNVIIFIWLLLLVLLLPKLLIPTINIFCVELRSAYDFVAFCTFSHSLSVLTQLWLNLTSCIFASLTLCKFSTVNFFLSTYYPLMIIIMIWSCWLDFFLSYRYKKSCTKQFVVSSKVVPSSSSMLIFWETGII